MWLVEVCVRVRARAPNKAASWSLVFSETIPLSQCAPFRCHNQLVNKSPPFIDFWETHTLLGPPPSFSMRSQGQHPWSTMVGCSGGNAACLVLQSVWHGIDCHVVLMLHSISCPHIHTIQSLLRAVEQLNGSAGGWCHLGGVKPSHWSVKERRCSGLAVS